MQKITKYLDYLIYWCIVLIPFFTGIAIGPENVFMGLLIAGYLAKCLLKKEKINFATGVIIPALFLFIVTCLSLFHSINYIDSFRGGLLRLWMYISVFFIVSKEVRDRKHLNKIIASVCFGITLVSLDSIWQVAGGRDFIRGYAPILNLGLVRATASFSDANLLGVYLSAFAPLLFGLTLYHFKSKQKITAGLLSLVVLAGIALTYSRPTLLAVYLALLFLALIRRDKALVIILLLAIVAAPWLLPRAVKDWAREVNYNPLRFMCNDDRIAVYSNSLNMIKKHPVIGLGANTYMKNYKAYKDSPEYRNVVTADFMYAHNNFLHLAAETGLLGLGVFLWLLYRVSVEARKIYLGLGQQPYLKIAALSLAACLVAFLINGLMESSLYYARVAVIFWYLSGLLLSLKNIA